MEGHHEGGPLMIHMIPVLFVVVPIVFAIIIYLIKYDWVTIFAFVAQLILIIVFVVYLVLWVDGIDRLIVFGGWNDRFAISFYIDRLTLLFVGLTLFMWTLILVYLFREHKSEHVFLFFFLFLEGVFMGLIQTNDLFNLFVFLELVTVLVTILIAYKKSGNAFRAGIYYLLLNTVGAMFFLLGIILIYYVYGTINIRILTSEMALYADQTIIRLAYVMMLSGISIKAAFFPLFAWLPRAHGVAQTPISALLSGLIVKGALYMFVRIEVMMFENAGYGTTELFFWIGAITGVVGVMFALVQKDLKQILAYHTISQIGIVMMGLSSTYALSFSGGVLHLVNHALFKSLLFLGAGFVIHAYQKKKVTEIQGVMRTMPLTALLLIVGMLSITGAPFFNGYVSKAMIKADFKAEPIKMVVYTIINIGTVTSFVKFSSILFGKKKAIHVNKGILEHIAMIGLAMACLSIGIMYPFLGPILLDQEIAGVTLFDMRSWLDYALYLGLGVIIYRFVITKDPKPIRSLRSFSIGFEDANSLFIVYLTVMSVLVLYILA